MQKFRIEGLAGQVVQVAPVVLWLYTFVLACCLFAPAIGAEAVQYLIDWAAFPADVLVFVALGCLLGSRLVRGYRRAGWKLMLAAVGVDLCIYLLYPTTDSTSRPVYQAIMDAGYVPYYALTIGACACFYVSCGGTFRGRHVWIDAATVLLGVGAILWATLYRYPEATASAGPVTFTAKLVYTAGISTTMMLALLLFPRTGTGNLDRAALLVVGGVVVGLLADVLWLRRYTGGTPLFQSINGSADLAVAVGDVTCCALIASAAATQWRQPPTHERPQSSDHSNYGILPALILLFAIVLLVGIDADQRELKFPVLAGMAVLIAMLLVARQLNVDEEIRSLDRALALKEADARLTELVRRSADVFIVVNGAGAISFVSAAAERILGVPSSKLQSSGATRMLGSTNEVALGRFLGDLAAGSAMSDEIELTLTAPTGERRVIRVVGSDQSENALIGGIVLTLSDVTEQRALERDVLNIAARERLRLCSDIHEGLGQDLTGIALMLQCARTSPVDDPKILQLSLRDVADHVSRAIVTARELAWGLSPLLIEGSLPHALRRIAATVNGRFPVEVCIEVTGPDEPVSELIADHLYRIAQEAVNNALRHAGGKAIGVSLRTAADDLVLTVADDGRGFDAVAARRQGLGLRMIEYRVRLLQGTLVVERPAGGGTRLVVCVPRGAS